MVSEKVKVKLVAIWILSNALQIGAIFPYLPQMILDFGLVEGRSSSGFYAWLLVSAFYIGRGIGAPIFGKIIDKRGRKWGLIQWMSAVIIFSLSLGFSTNVQQATLARLGMGLFNISPAVVRTALNEMCTSNGMKTYAMGIDSLYVQIGKSVALFIGGILVHPEKIGFPDTSIFVQFPYLLPNVCISFVAIIGMLAAIFVYKETLTDITKNETDTTYMELLSDFKIQQVLIQFSIFTLIITGFGKLQVLWFFSNKHDGGFQLDSQEIGMILGIPSIIALIIQSTKFKDLIAARGFIWATKIGFIQWVVMFGLLPLTSYFQNYKYLCYSAVVVLTIWSNAITFQENACISGMINNSTYPVNRGKVNSLETAISSLVTGFVSPVVSIMFSLAWTEGWPFPFNYWLPFFLLSALAATNAILASRLPEELETSPELRETDAVELKLEEDKPLAASDALKF